MSTACPAFFENTMRRYRSDHREPEEDRPTPRDEDRLGKGRVAAAAQQPVWQTPTSVVRTVITHPQTPASVRRYRSYHGEAERDRQTSRRDEERLGKGVAVATAGKPVRQSPIAAGVSVRTAADPHTAAPVASRLSCTPRGKSARTAGCLKGRVRFLSSTHVDKPIQRRDPEVCASAATPSSRRPLVVCFTA